MKTRKKRIVLFSTLYYADESKVSRDLVLRLEEHIKDEVVTPSLLLNKCFLIYGERDFKGYSSDDRKLDAIEELQHALIKACTLSPNVMVKKAAEMKEIVRGWKISRGHRRNKENRR